MPTKPEREIVVFQSQVNAELAEMKGNKAALMQKYSDQQRVILNQYGGSLSDIPSNPDHIFYKLQDKIQILGRM